MKKKPNLLHENQILTSYNNKIQNKSTYKIKIASFSQGNKMKNYMCKPSRMRIFLKA